MSVSASHNKAMEFAERAFLAQIRGPRKNQTELFEKALQYELEAISKMEAEGRTEPTYSVLHRSAGTLALHCNEFQQAREIVTKALNHDPHPEIADELRELQYQISLFLLPKSPYVARTHKDILKNSNFNTPIRTLKEVA